MEIELKLATDEGALAKFEATLLNSLAGTIQQTSLDLFNDYYDTQEQWLGKRKMGFRVRCVNGHIEQTIKTQGQVKGGLHERPEYNVTLSEAVPDLSLFDQDIWPENVDIKQLNQQLVLQFSTHFQRTLFDIKTDQAHIELVFDQGKVSTQNDSLPISEIELELKSGHPSALFDLADEIGKVIPVRVSNITKAARGYQLLNDSAPITRELPKFLSLSRNDSTEEGLCKAIECALAHWQHHEYVYLQTRHLKALNEIAKSIDLLLQSVSLYLPVLQCQELLVLHKQLLILAQQWRWQSDLTCIRNLRSKKGPFSKRVPKNQMLMSYLNGRREGLLAVQSPEQLLMSMESNQVQLGASRLLVEKPWRQQVSDYDALVIKHARGWLSQGWQTIMQSLPTSAMDHHKYLTLEVLLRQTLMNGFLLADLFAESRGKFRAPWLDLLSGLDEVNSLMFLQEVIQEVDIEDKKEMQAWIADKLSSVIQVMEQSREVAMQADVYW